MDKNEAETRAHEAYLDLLGIPLPSQARDQAQKALAFLRDYLSDLTNEDPEMVQMAYEEEAFRRLPPFTPAVGS